MEHQTSQEDMERESLRQRLLEIAHERDQRMEATAIEAEREGDTECCWYAMAVRAENKRFIQKLESEK